MIHCLQNKNIVITELRQIQTTYQIKKVFEVAEVVMKRRNEELTDLDQKILESVFEESKKYRNS